MSPAVVPLKGRAVELPWKMLIVAAQPYHTISGPALSVNFLLQPTLFSFQGLPFYEPDAPGRYFHSLLHSLAEFGTTPRRLRRSNVEMMHAPMENFWQSVGVLNCVYHTRYFPFDHKHPAMGAVELASPLHRKQKNVRLSLYSATHQPIASMVLSGTSRDTADCQDNCTDVALPHSGVDKEISQIVFLEDVRRLADGSVFQQAIFKNSGQHNSDVVPPWQLDRCVAEFCQVLAKAGLLAPSVSGDGRCMWTIAAHQTLAQAELLADEPFDIVTASPRIFQRYRMPPWRHRIGLPLFSGDTQPLCVALRVEMRQKGRTLTSGTYFLTTVSLCA